MWVERNRTNVYESVLPQKPHDSINEIFVPPPPRGYFGVFDRGALVGGGQSMSRVAGYQTFWESQVMGKVGYGYYPRVYPYPKTRVRVGVIPVRVPEHS